MALPLSDKEPQPEWFSWALNYPIESGFVKSKSSNNINIHYLRWNPPIRKVELSSSLESLPQSVVLLHGTAAHAHWYHHIGPFIAEDGYEVIAISFSGHGDSEIDPNMRSGFDAWSKQVVDVCEELQLFDSRRISMPIIVGHSLGSHVAEKICTEVEHSKIGGLVILDGGIPHPFYWQYQGNNMTMIDQVFNSKKNVEPRQQREYSIKEYSPVDRLSLAPPQAGVPPYVLEHIANTGARMLKNEDGSLSEKWVWKVDPDYSKKTGFPLFVNKIGLPEKVLNFQTRVAVVFGEHSIVVGKSTRQYMRHVLGGNIPVITIPAAGHHCILDQPLACVSAFRSIFAEWNRSCTLTGTGHLLPRLGIRATMGTNEDGGYDGKDELMQQRSLKELRRFRKPSTETANL